MQIPSEECQYGVPDAGSHCGVEHEASEVHLAQSGGNGDELSDAGQQASDEGSNGSVAIEVAFGGFHLFAAEQAEASCATFDEAVDYRASYIIGDDVVGRGSDDAADGGEEDDQPDVHSSLGCHVAGGRYYDFGGERYGRAFNGHQYGNGIIV